MDIGVKVIWNKTQNFISPFCVPRKIPVIISIHPHIHGCKEVMNMKEDTILKVLTWDVRSIIQKEKLEFEYLQEIRLREGKPLIFLYHDTEVIPGAKARRPYLVTKDNIREMLVYKHKIYMLCPSSAFLSVHSFQILLVVSFIFLYTCYRGDTLVPPPELF